AEVDAHGRVETRARPPDEAGEVDVRELVPERCPREVAAGVAGHDWQATAGLEGPTSRSCWRLLGDGVREGHALSPGPGDGEHVVDCERMLVVLCEAVVFVDAEGETEALAATATALASGHAQGRDCDVPLA